MVLPTVGGGKNHQAILLGSTDTTQKVMNKVPPKEASSSPNPLLCVATMRCRETDNMQIRRQCDTCPLVSPMGTLNASITDIYTIVKDATLNWTLPAICLNDCKKSERLSGGLET